SSVRRAPVAEKRILCSSGCASKAGGANSAHAHNNRIGACSGLDPQKLLAIVSWVACMSIDSDQEIGVGSIIPSSKIDPNRLNPTGIVHQNDAAVQVGLPLYDFTRAIGAAPVRDHNAQVHWLGLGADLSQHRFDVGCLIEAWNHHQRKCRSM